MINVSNEFKELMQTRTDFKEYAEITLTDGTKITLDESQFTVTNNRVTDGAAISAVPIGVAVQKIAQLEVLNDQEQWEDYDFFGAKIHLYLTFELSSTTEKVERGLYTVTTPETYGETVIITAYDDMYKTDKNYSTTLSFPNTLKNMLIDICQTCGVPLLSTTFANDDFTVLTKPDGQYTCRQIIGYIAMLAGGNARINNAGYLEISTYANITGNQYYSSLDGIETGAPERVLKSWQSLTTDKNDISITGVALSITKAGGQEKHLTGEEGYVITVTNPLINAEDETTLATAMCDISEHLIGLTFRKFDGTSVANPLIEFMDFVAVKDRRGQLHKSFITDITFSFLGSTTVKNSAESVVRSSAVYAGNISTEVRFRKLVEEEKTARELAVETLSTALANSSGMYETEEAQADGSTIYYFHDKPTMTESMKIIKLTADAIGVSSDGGKTYPYGFTVTGEMVTRLLATEGINADWIKTGVLSADRIDVDALMSKHLTSTGGLDVTGEFYLYNEYGCIKQYELDGFPRTVIANDKTTADFEAHSAVSVGHNSVDITSVDVPLSESYTGGGHSALVVGNAISLLTGKYVGITANQGVVINNNTSVDGDVSVSGNLTAGNLESGSWTPTVSGAASYTLQTGRYIKIGDMAVVAFSVYGTFAGSTTERFYVSGCPLTPADNHASGGGILSGYTAASNIIFTGWQGSKNGNIYAVGQQTGTTGTTKWASTAIYQKASGDFAAAGTIAFKISS